MTVANEPTVNDLNPLFAEGVEKELVALIDTSGSMSWAAAEGSTTTRFQVVGESIGMLVKYLEDLDSQAEAEQADGSDELGGLLTYTFASTTTELGDLNSSNWRERWAKIHLGGGTQIMPAWAEAQREYLKEFGQVAVAKRPNLLTLVITDGEADDGAEFGRVLKDADSTEYFCIAIVGFGADHDATLNAYKAIEKENPSHVRVVTFGTETDPKAIADGLLAIAG